MFLEHAGGKVTAFVGDTTHTPRTAFKKPFGRPTRFNIEYLDEYPDGNARFKAVAAAPKGFSVSAKTFRTIDELHAAFGKPTGGTKAEYLEESYKRNKKLNPSALGSGSTHAAPNVIVGNSYLHRSEAGEAVTTRRHWLWSAAYLVVAGCKPSAPPPSTNTDEFGEPPVDVGGEVAAAPSPPEQPVPPAPPRTARCSPDRVVLQPRRRVPA